MGKKESVLPLSSSPLLELHEVSVEDGEEEALHPVGYQPRFKAASEKA